MTDEIPKGPVEVKVDEIIAGNKAVKSQLNRRTAGVVAVCIIFAFVLFRLNNIAEYNKAANKINVENGIETKTAVQILTDATGPDAQAKSAATLKGAIDDLRHSINCVTIYVHFNEKPPACNDVIARVEALRNSRS